jgi:hypothetical protein
MWFPFFFIFLFFDNTLLEELSVCQASCNFSTISSAIQAAQDNEVITVHAGNYTENTTIISNKTLTIATSGGVVYVYVPTGQQWINITENAVVSMAGSIMILNSYVVLSQNGVWHQNGTISFILTQGLSFNGGIWHQNGDVTITISSSAQEDVNAITFAGSMWNQKGNLIINSMATGETGVAVCGGFWNQSGNVIISMNSITTGGT